MEDDWYFSFDEDRFDRQYDDFTKSRLSKGIIFIPKSNILSKAIVIAELQNTLYESKTLFFDEWIVIEGYHEYFVDQFKYYDAVFITQNNMTLFHSFKPQAIPLNINLKDLDFSAGY